MSLHLLASKGPHRDDPIRHSLDFAKPLPVEVLDRFSISEAIRAPWTGGFEESGRTSILSGESTRFFSADDSATMGKGANSLLRGDPLRCLGRMFLGFSVAAAKLETYYNMVVLEIYAYSAITP